MGHQPELQIEQRKLLDLHLELVLKENERSNLTRIVDWQQGQLLHIEDSLVGLQEFETLLQAALPILVQEEAFLESL